MNTITKFGIGEDVGWVKVSGQSMRKLVFSDGTWLIPKNRFNQLKLEPTTEAMTKMYAADMWQMLLKRKTAPQQLENKRKQFVFEIFN